MVTIKNTAIEIPKAVKNPFLGVELKATMIPATMLNITVILMMRWNRRSCVADALRQQTLYFFPLPHGHGALRPIAMVSSLLGAYAACHFQGCISK